MAGGNTDIEEQTPASAIAAAGYTEIPDGINVTDIASNDLMLLGADGCIHEYVRLEAEHRALRLCPDSARIPALGEVLAIAYNVRLFSRAKC